MYIRPGIDGRDESLLDFKGREFILVHILQPHNSGEDEQHEDETDYVLVFNGSEHHLRSQALVFHNPFIH